MSNEQAFYWMLYGVMWFLGCMLIVIPFWLKNSSQDSVKPKPPKELLYL